MSWEQCVTEIQNYFKPTPAQDAGKVDWSKVPESDLENDTFKNNDPFVLICPDRHCVDYVSTTPAAHALCQCKDMSGNHIPGCTPPSALYPEKASVCLDVDTGAFGPESGRACMNKGASWYQLTCYCCCSCFANGTKIAIPGPAGFKKIEDFQANIDNVSTAKISTAGANISLDWGVSRVTFSQGTGPDSHQSVMISITFDNPDIEDGLNSIIVTPDHLFLLSNGKLCRADKIVPGKHFLVNKEGNAVPIHEISHGAYNGGVHHIATGKTFTGSMDDHLILAAGIVTGDFTLQINSGNIKDLMVDDHENAPKIGSKEYVAKHTNLKAVNYAKFQTADLENKKVHTLNANFFAHGDNTTNIPSTASTYLSPEQEKDVDDKLDLIHFTDLAAKSNMIQHLIKLYKGFFPDINIYFDSSLTGANAYAFENQYKEKKIIISGGFARISELSFEGLTVIIAHMISTIQKSSPVNQYGYTTVGMADYYSMQIVGTVFFPSMSSDIIDKGIDQITKSLFDNISPAHKAFETDPYKPTIDTRLDALEAGSTMNFPPVGIGGPEFHGLNLESASSNLPHFNQTSFITDDITAAMSSKAYNQLVEHNILTQDGILSTTFNIKTDLSFLFNELDAAQENLLTEEVRYILLHPNRTVVLTFNKEMSADRILALDDFEFSPDVKVTSAALGEFNPKMVHLTVSGMKTTEQYTLTVSSQLYSANGSTVNPEHNSVTVN